jgi:hypothetical protein
MHKKLEAKEDTKTEEDYMDQLQEKLEGLSLRIVPKNQRSKKSSHVPIDLSNEKGII